MAIQQLTKAEEKQLDNFMESYLSEKGNLNCIYRIHIALKDAKRHLEIRCADICCLRYIADKYGSAWDIPQKRQ